MPTPWRLGPVGCPQAVQREVDLQAGRRTAGPPAAPDFDTQVVDEHVGRGRLDVVQELAQRADVGA